MKRIIMVVLGMTLLYNICSAEEYPDMKDEKTRLSYSTGFQVGVDFLQQGTEINPEMLLKGVQDALADNKPLFKHQEIKAALIDLQKKIAVEQEIQLKAHARKNMAEGMAYLAENSKKEGIKALPSGLQYKVITKGSGKAPKAGDSVTVHYRGTLINGTEFDSSYSRGKPAAFKADRVIDGWKEALPLMREGAKWQLFIPPELGYGDKRTGRIEPNSTLIFMVELISVEQADQQINLK